MNLVIALSFVSVLLFAASVLWLWVRELSHHDKTKEQLKTSQAYASGSENYNRDLQIKLDEYRCLLKKKLRRS